MKPIFRVFIDAFNFFKYCYKSNYRCNISVLIEMRRVVVQFRMAKEGSPIPIK